MVNLIDGNDYDIDDIQNSSQCVCGRELQFTDYGTEGLGADCACGRSYGTCASKVTIIISGDYEDNEEEGDDASVNQDDFEK